MMRSYNQWLWEQLRVLHGRAVEDRYAPLINLHTPKNGIVKIWCPPPEDYRVTADCVHEVADIGAHIISYANQWGDATEEAIIAAKGLRIDILPHGGTLNMLGRWMLR